MHGGTSYAIFGDVGISLICSVYNFFSEIFLH